MVYVLHLLIHFLIFCSLTTAKAESPELVAQLGYETTSDGFFLSRYHLQYRDHRRDHLFPYTAEQPEGFDWGADLKHTRGQTNTEAFSGNRFRLLAGYKFSEKYRVDGRLGLHTLEPSVSPSKTMTIGEVFFGFFPTSSLGGSLRLGRDLVYHDLVLPAGVLESLSANTVDVRLLSLLGTHWRIPALISSRTYSDGNQRSEIDLALMYGISPGVPWIWIGIGGNQLLHAGVQPTYWSPSRFLSGGPRLDLAVPFADQWTIAAAINLNRFYDQDTATWGSGHYADIGLRYGDRNATNLGLNYISINSHRALGIWVSSAIVLNFSTPL